MRNNFLTALLDLAEEDERIWLLCGDLGYSVLEPFAERYPGRYINMGVAEQNMAGVAAGLAMTGKIVFIYSIANFPIMRCLEQIRNDICYHNLNVKIVAVGCGLAYGSHGYTHHGVEDLAIMRALPNMVAVAPGDPVEARLATRAVATWDGPCYLRLGKANEPVVHESEPEFRIGQAIRMREGKDICLVSTGGMLPITVAAADQLEREGYSTQVLSMHTVSPLDKESIVDAAKRIGKIITVEEHGPGGLGSVVAEALAEAGCAVRFRAMRLDPSPLKRAGSQETLRSAQGLSVKGIVECAQALIIASMPALSSRI
jgi:transketolase